MVRILKALILLGAAVWSGPCPNPAQQWLLSPQCSVWTGHEAQTSKATPGRMFHGSARLTLPWDKRQLKSKRLFQAGWRHEYPEAPPCKPCNISWLLGWYQEPVWTPTVKVQPRLGPRLDLQGIIPPVPPRKAALHFQIRKSDIWK